MVFYSSQVYHMKLLCDGDIYKVFHTVLSTIPIFLEMHDTAYVIVRASDSDIQFRIDCMKKCSRNCQSGFCRKFERRLKIYRHFVDKYETLLLLNYEILGGVTDIEDFLKFERYKPRFRYDAIMVSRKSRKFIS
jgi:hypothetical protein